MSNAFLIKIVPTSVEAILPPSRTVPSTVLTATNTASARSPRARSSQNLICHRRAKHGFGKNFASEQPSISGSVGGHPEPAKVVVIFASLNMPFCMLRDARTSNVGASSSGANARSVSISEISFWIWSRCSRHEANLFPIKNRFLKLAEKSRRQNPAIKSVSLSCARSCRS